MVFYIIGRGITGFSIYSENNEISNFNDKVSYYGKIKFETDNEIVIKDKIAYIR